MPAIPESTRSPITLRLLDHARQHWPRLGKLRVTSRAGFAYVTAALPGEQEPQPLFRLRYGGSAHSFGFALYSYAAGRYEDSLLTTGSPVGTPQDALDTACLLYYTDDADDRPSAEPPTNLRGRPLSAGDQQFVSDMQSTFQFGSGVKNSEIVSFGERVSSDGKAGVSIASEASTVQQDWTSTAPGEAIRMILLAEEDICPREQATQTVTYVATGSNATITYSPDGSSYQGTAPMSVTLPLGNPPSDSYVTVAQLNGGGSVSCQVKVDGVTIASASAVGGYNSARCQIGQDRTGSWENELAER